MKIKNAIASIKSKAKERAPEIAFMGYALLSAAGWAIAGYYSIKLQQERDKPKMPGKEGSHHFDNWETVEVPPDQMADIRNGATLKYREKRIGDHWLAQSTTMSEFGRRANEEFEKFKETGVIRPISPDSDD